MQEQEREREWIASLQRGDIRGLEGLVRMHQLRAVRTAYLITRDLALAQDIVQAAFLRAYERIRQLDPNRPFGPWFRTSVLRAAIKVANKRARYTSLPPLLGESIVDNEPGPEELWERAETADEVWAALGRLSATQRAAIVSRYFLGLSESEMTQLLECAPSTVKWRLHTARQRLRLLLLPAATE